MKPSALLLAALLALMQAGAPDEEQPMLRGLEHFEAGRWAEALACFRQAEEADPSDLTAKYNSHRTVLAQEELALAEQELTEKYAALASARSIRAAAAYNLGTAYLAIADEADKAGALAQAAAELEQARSWLQRSLLDNSADREAKNNLEYANKLAEKLQQQQGEGEQQEGEEGDRQQDRQEGEGQQQEGQGEQGEGKEQEGEQQEREEQQGSGQEGQQGQAQPREQESGSRAEGQQREIPEETARNLLEAARNAEMRAIRLLREQLNRKAGRRPRVKKDW